MKKSNDHNEEEKTIEQFIGKNSLIYSKTKKINVLPQILRKNRVISIGQNNKISNAYKILRTRILQRMKIKEWKTLGITSTEEKEGKSLTAVNLAISIAQDSRHTALLVDFNFQSPGLQSFFELKPENGINDYFLNNTPIEEILINPGIEGLVILPCIKPIKNSSETLSSETAIKLVNELKERYKDRVIIFDLPPLLSSDDVIAFSPYIDTALLVIEDGKTKKENLVQSINYLGKTPLIGTVLNKSGGRSLMRK